MRAGVVAGVAIAALVLAGGGSARSGKVVSLKLGDVVEVAGSKIVCTVQKSKRLIPGRKLVGCTEANRKGPVVGSYAVALAADGEVAVAKVKPDGTPKVTFRRKPAAVGGAADRTLTVRAGDVMTLTGSDVTCAVNKTDAGAGITCFRFSAGAAIAGTYGIGLNDRLAFVVRFDAAHKPRTVYLRRHGS